MGIADELQKLSDLLSQGRLTTDEYAQAKTKLLANPTTTTQIEVGSFLEDQLTAVRYQNELARIDREWDIERRQYEIVGRYGSRWVPTVGAGLATALAGSVFGGLWMAICFTAFAMSQRTGITTDRFGIDGSLFSGASIILPLIGLLIIVTAVGRGLYWCMLAHNYRVVYDAYQRRHKEATLADQTVAQTSSALP